ncbi:MAG: peroxiredoxin [Leptospiraceae bacterium]|nr:peroxiredoxin [Leptospiraceae bacterium]
MSELTGKVLPSVSLDSSAGGKVNLPGDIKGHYTVLYFYPKDDTPGCTKQACAYRDHLKDFTDLGAKVYGVSLDDLTSHDAFINKYSLNFPLLADVDKELSTALGVYGDQQWGDKVFKGLSRDSFLIDPEGKIVKIWRKVNPTESIAETYEEIKSRAK